VYKKLFGFGLSELELFNAKKNRTRILLVLQIFTDFKVFALKIRIDLFYPPNPRSIFLI